MLNAVRTVMANIVECSARAGSYKHHTYTNIRPPLHCPGYRPSYNPSWSVRKQANLSVWIFIL